MSIAQDVEAAGNRMGMLPGMMSPEGIASMRETIARMEGKLDAALALKRDFDIFEGEARIALNEANTRLVKLEAFNGFLLWIAGGVWALTCVAFAAALTYGVH